eukprot:IDg11253t1
MTQSVPPMRISMSHPPPTAALSLDTQPNRTRIESSHFPLQDPRRTRPALWHGHPLMTCSGCEAGYTQRASHGRKSESPLPGPTLVVNLAARCFGRTNDAKHTAGEQFCRAFTPNNFRASARHSRSRPHAVQQIQIIVRDGHRDQIQLEVGAPDQGHTACPLGARGEVVQPFSITHYTVMLPETGQIFRCKATNYRPYNQMLDNARSLVLVVAPHGLHQPRVNSHRAIPATACSAQLSEATTTCSQLPKKPQRRSSRPPRTLREARRRLDAALQRAAYEKEVRTQCAFGTLERVQRDAMPQDAVVHKLLPTCTYKTYVHEHVVGHK